MLSLIQSVPKIPLGVLLLQRSCRSLHSLSSPSNPAPCQPLPKGSHSPPNDSYPIREQDIKIFTVEARKLANRLRSTELQLQCIGGTAKDSDHHPQQMQFVNAGVDTEGTVNWVGHTSSMNSKVQMGAIQVAFEGWSGPGDEYVRAGSEVVRYELNWSEDTNDTLKYIVVIIIVLCVTAIIFRAQASSPREEGTGPIPTDVDMPRYPTQPSKVIYEESPVIVHQKPPQVIYRKPSVVVVRDSVETDKVAKVIYEEPPVIVRRKQPRVIYEEPSVVVPGSWDNEKTVPKTSNSQDTYSPRTVVAKSSRSE